MVAVVLASKCASVGVSQCLLTHYREPNCIKVNPLTDNSVARIPGAHSPPTESPMAVVSSQTPQRQYILCPLTPYRKSNSGSVSSQKS